MSHGFTAHADLVQASGTMLVYAYSCCNINLPGWESHKTLFDGEIRINRNDLTRLPIELLCEAGKVTIKNASGTWTTIAARCGHRSGEIVGENCRSLPGNWESA